MGYNYGMNSTRPYFLWDYDLTEDDVRRILRGKNQTDKIWIMSRILASAHFDDVWRYLSVREIVDHFDELRIRPQIKNAWQRALTVWGYHV